MKYTNRQLYGGAITLNIPEGFENVSSVRDIPNHQEVFVDNFSECSIIVEILEPVDAPRYRNSIAEYYFNDISEFNDSLSTKIVCSEPLSAYSSGLQISKCTGVQVLDKRYQKGVRREDLYLCLLVLRVMSKNADIVISFNCPSQHINPCQYPSADTDQSFRKLSQNEVDEAMNEILRSFAIKDYNLFV